MFEMTAEWWFSEPSEYVVNVGKDKAYEAISPFEFLASFASAVQTNESLHSFAKKLLKIPRTDGMRIGKKRFNTWELQNYLKHNTLQNEEVKVDKFMLTLEEICQGVVFIFSVMDIYEDDGLGDPRVILVDKLERFLSKGDQ